MEQIEINIDEFYERIKLLLKKKQTTQTEMFKYIDSTKQYFYYCKKVKIIPNIAILFKIAKYFNVTINYLLWGKDDLFSDEEILLLIKIKNLTAEKKEKFFDHVFTYLLGLEDN